MDSGHSKPFSKPSSPTDQTTPPMRKMSKPRHFTNETGMVFDTLDPDDQGSPVANQEDDYEIESDDEEPDELDQMPDRDPIRRVTMMQNNMEKLGIKLNSGFDPSDLFRSLIGRNMNKFDQSYSREEQSPQ